MPSALAHRFHFLFRFGKELSALTLWSAKLEVPTSTVRSLETSVGGLQDVVRREGSAEFATGSEHMKEKGTSLTEAMAFAPNVTECYIQVTLHSFDGILRSGKISMVFSGYGDLSILPDQFSLMTLVSTIPSTSVRACWHQSTPIHMGCEVLG